MNIADLDNYYDENFSRFSNVHCYRFLAGWKGGIRTEEQCLKEEEEMVVQENKKSRERSGRV